jgi:hypothetical protein
MEIIYNNAKNVLENNQNIKFDINENLEILNS